MTNPDGENPSGYVPFQAYDADIETKWEVCAPSLHPCTPLFNRFTLPHAHFRDRLHNTTARSSALVKTNVVHTVCGAIEDGTIRLGGRIVRLAGGGWTLGRTGAGARWCSTWGQRPASRATSGPRPTRSRTRTQSRGCSRWGPLPLEKHLFLQGWCFECSWRAARNLIQTSSLPEGADVDGALSDARERESRQRERLECPSAQRELSRACPELLLPPDVLASVAILPLAHCRLATCSSFAL